MSPATAERLLFMRCYVAERLVELAYRVMPGAGLDEDVHAVLATVRAASEIHAAGARHLEESHALRAGADR